VTNSEDTGRPGDAVGQVQVQVGPGVAPSLLEYASDRLRGLQRYAPRAISRIEARVSKPRDTGMPGAVLVRATLTVGNHVLRAHATTPAVRSALDAVCDRLRRQLTDLPHGRRGDYVPHHGSPAHDVPNSRTTDFEGRR
jgi:ribosome-associated translation inhibitor RaiA